MVGNSVAMKRNPFRNRKLQNYNNKKHDKEPQNMELRRSQRVAAKRLTIPLGFFSSGIKLTASRNSCKTDIGHARIVLNEDLHSLLKNFDSRSDCKTKSPKSSSSLVLEEEQGGEEEENEEEEEGNERFGRANPDLNRFPAGILPGGKLLKGKNREKTYANLSEYFREISTKNQIKKRSEKVAKNENEVETEDDDDGEKENENEEELHEIECFQENVGVENLWGVSSSKGKSKFEVYSKKLKKNEKPTSINISFCTNLLLDVKPSRKSRKKQYLFKVRETAQIFDDILDGKIPPQVLLPSEATMSTKRSLPEDYEDNNLTSSTVTMALVPQSQWVYSTPDKCGMKKFVFEDRNKDKMVPAVIQTTKKNKVLYDIKNEMIQNVNLTRYVKDDQAIPIDKRFLNAIYQEDIGATTTTSTTTAKRPKLEENKENFFNFKEPLTKKRDNKENVDFNLFLSNNEEKTIDIDVGEAPSISPMEVSLPLSEDSFDMNLLVEDPYDKAPVDYQHQLLLATQRPSKTTKKIPKRHMLKAKSLSFEATPPRGRPLGFEPKKLECLDEFEAQFNRLGENSDNNFENIDINIDNINNIDSIGNIDNKREFKTDFDKKIDTKNEKIESNELNLANFVVPAFKFYPRRNYDCK